MLMYIISLQHAVLAGLFDYSLFDGDGFLHERSFIKYSRIIVVDYLYFLFFNFFSSLASLLNLYIYVVTSVLTTEFISSLFHFDLHTQHCYLYYPFKYSYLLTSLILRCPSFLSTNNFSLCVGL